MDWVPWNILCFSLNLGLKGLRFFVKGRWIADLRRWARVLNSNFDISEYRLPWNWLLICKPWFDHQFVILTLILLRLLHSTVVCVCKLDFVLLNGIVNIEITFYGLIWVSFVFLHFIIIEFREFNYFSSCL